MLSYKNVHPGSEVLLVLMVECDVIRISYFAMIIYGSRNQLSGGSLAEPAVPLTRIHREPVLSEEREKGISFITNHDT